MKNLFNIIIILTIIPFSFAGTIAEDLPGEVEKVMANPSEENVVNLAKEISGNIKHRSLLSPESIRATENALEKILTIPGHARYFLNLVEAERLNKNKPPHGADYDSLRYLYLKQVLEKLPSPETVQVLGHYLADDRDTPPPKVPNQDWYSTPANSYIATDALMEIGINNSPVPKGVMPWEQKALDLQRAWWKEVKSGKRSFSFYRQNVEYRFTPEGAVTSTPRDGSRDPEPLDRYNARHKTIAKSNHLNAYLIVGGSAAALAILSVIWLKRKKA